MHFSKRKKSHVVFNKETWLKTDVSEWLVGSSYTKC